LSVLLFFFFSSTHLYFAFNASKQWLLNKIKFSYLGNWLITNIWYCVNKIILKQIFSLFISFRQTTPTNMTRKQSVWPESGQCHYLKTKLNKSKADLNIRKIFPNWCVNNWNKLPKRWLIIHCSVLGRHKVNSNRLIPNQIYHFHFLPTPITDWSRYSEYQLRVVYVSSKIVIEEIFLN